MLQSENFINPAEIFRLEAAHRLEGNCWQLLGVASNSPPSQEAKRGP
jgi:hypothetical protein